MINGKDLSNALAALRRSGGYAATIVLTLGLTLGALVTMFDLNYQLLAKPLPYPAPERLHISQGNSYRDGQVAFEDQSPYPGLVLAYRQDAGHVEQAALMSARADVIRNRRDSPRVNVGYVTPEFFPLLHVPLALGRPFGSAEGVDTNSPIAVISHAAWQELFDSDPQVLGQALRFGEVDFQIVGVVGKDFVEPLPPADMPTQVWLPWDYNHIPRPARNSWTRTNVDQHLLVRLKAGTSVREAEHGLTNLLNSRFKEETAAQPLFSAMTIDFKLVPLRDKILGDSKDRVLLLFAGVLALLLIAAANITNLTLARAASQQRNMAIQAALGAQQNHLFAAVFAEILVLMGLVAVLSIAVAFAGIQLLKALAHSYLPRLAELHLNWESVGFALLSAFILAALFALLISRQINYRALHTMLQSGGKGAGIQISGTVRKALIVSQVALTGVLLAASAHVLQLSLRNIAQPLGFVTDDIYYLALSLGGQQQAESAQRKNDLQAIRAKLRSDPKVANASLTSGVPIHSQGDAQFQSAWSADADLQQQSQAATSLVDESYLPMLGLRLIQGRNFEPGEERAETKVVIVNETFARRLQGDGQVMGKRFYWRNSPDRGKTPYEVVGIVRDLSLPDREEAARAFVPQIFDAIPLFLVQFKPGQQLGKVELNDLMAQVNGEYKVAVSLSMARAHSMLIAQDSLSAAVTAALVLLAISLAAIGIYGVLSYTVLIRRPELGIRMAVGARPVTVFAHVLRDNMGLTLIGLALALTALGGIWRWLQSTTYTLEVSITSWIVAAVLLIVLTAVTTLLSVWGVIGKPAIDAIRNS